MVNLTVGEIYQHNGEDLDEGTFMSDVVFVVYRVLHRLCPQSQ